jgi:hypothetical protein
MTVIDLGEVIRLPAERHEGHEKGRNAIAAADSHASGI